MLSYNNPLTVMPSQTPRKRYSYMNNTLDSLNSHNSGSKNAYGANRGQNTGNAYSYNVGLSGGMEFTGQQRAANPLGCNTNLNMSIESQTAKTIFGSHLKPSSTLWAIKSQSIGGSNEKQNQVQGSYQVWRHGDNKSSHKQRQNHTEVIKNKSIGQNTSDEAKTNCKQEAVSIPASCPIPTQLLHQAALQFQKFESDVIVIEKLLHEKDQQMKELIEQRDKWKGLVMEDRNTRCITKADGRPLYEEESLEVSQSQTDLISVDCSQMVSSQRYAEDTNQQTGGPIPSNLPLESNQQILYCYSQVARYIPQSQLRVGSHLELLPSTSTSIPDNMTQRSIISQQDQATMTHCRMSTSHGEVCLQTQPVEKEDSSVNTEIDWIIMARKQLSDGSSQVEIELNDQVSQTQQNIINQDKLTLIQPHKNTPSSKCPEEYIPKSKTPLNTLQSNPSVSVSIEASQKFRLHECPQNHSESIPYTHLLHLYQSLQSRHLQLQHQLYDLEEKLFDSNAQLEMTKRQLEAQRVLKSIEGRIGKYRED